MNEKKRLLFVCTANRQRSPTAADLFAGHPRYEARSCGVSALGGTPCSESLIRWADLIFCMEKWHREVLRSEVPGAEEKRILVLRIPDVYRRNDPELVTLLKDRLAEWLEEPPR